MKKNITRENNQRGSHKMTIGIDLGYRSSRYCTEDEQVDVVSEGSFATTKAGVERLFASMGRCRVGGDPTMAYVRPICTPPLVVRAAIVAPPEPSWKDKFFPTSPLTFTGKSTCTRPLTVEVSTLAE